jgi:hypothetical protein
MQHDDTRRTGISNRETPAEEAREREEFPPETGLRPEPEDAAGRTGEAPLEGETPDRQTSHKAGSRSVAQKEDGSKYSDRPMPQTTPVPGASGREPE